MTHIPASARTLILVLGVITLLSALPLAIMAAFAGGWSMLGFETVIAVAGGVAVLLARGKFADGPALAICCIAGTIFVGSVLGYIGVQRVLFGVSLTPLLLGRVATAGIFGLLAAWLVLRRNPRSIRPLLVGVLLGIPVLAAVAVAVLPQAKPLLAPITGTPKVVQIMLALLAFIVFGGLFSASAHLIIRAFELGRPEEYAPPSAQEPQPKP